MDRIKKWFNTLGAKVNTSLVTAKSNMKFLAQQIILHPRQATVNGWFVAVSLILVVVVILILDAVFAIGGAWLFKYNMQFYRRFIYE